MTDDELRAEVAARPVGIQQGWMAQICHLLTDLALRRSFPKAALGRKCTISKERRLAPALSVKWACPLWGWEPTLARILASGG